MTHGFISSLTSRSLNPKTWEYKGRLGFRGSGNPNRVCRLKGCQRGAKHLFVSRNTGKRLMVCRTCITHMRKELKEQVFETK